MPFISNRLAARIAESRGKRKAGTPEESKDKKELGNKKKKAKLEKVIMFLSFALLSIINLLIIPLSTYLS